MPGVHRGGRRPLKRLIIVLASGLGVLTVLVAAWLVWSLLRPRPPGFAPTAGQAASIVEAPQVLQYTIDARDKKNWAYFDVASGAAVQTSPTSLDWDLAFRRTDILTNGGSTNPSGLGGAIDLGKIAIEDATAPADGYLADVEHEDRGLENPALHKWYDYDWTTHTVSARDRTYAIRTATGETSLLTFVSYYCADGSSGCVTFRYLYPLAP